MEKHIINLTIFKSAYVHCNAKVAVTHKLDAEARHSVVMGIEIH